MEDNTLYVPEPAIRRLPWYLACVSRFRAQGVEYVSSTAISHQLNVDASQIAKDLSYLNIKGKTRIGYEVKELERGLLDFLGFHQVHNAVMMGVGSLGAALIADSGLSRYGLNIVAGFDVDPTLIGTEIGGKPIYDLAELPWRRKQLNAEIAVIAVPVERPPKWLSYVSIPASRLSGISLHSISRPLLISLSRILRYMRISR